MPRSSRTCVGVKADRPGLAEAVAYARDGDTLTLWKLDRLDRSMKHLIEAVIELEGKGVGFRSLTENIDTTTSGGRLVLHLFERLQFERDLIRERTRAGLKAAEDRGRSGGGNLSFLRTSSTKPGSYRERSKCKRGGDTFENRENCSVRSIEDGAGV